jgi:hypothetical protein
VTEIDPSIDVTRDALSLAAVVLSAGPREEYDATVDALVRTPRASVQVLARLLLALSGESALCSVRHMAVMHDLAELRELDTDVQADP